MAVTGRLFLIRLVWILPALAAMVSGCATVPKPTRSGFTGQGVAANRCVDFFHALDQRTRSADALDGGVFRVPGFPYLRVDRFTASFARETDESQAFAIWVDRLQALDQEARRHEIDNLAGEGEREALLGRVAVCGDLLRSAELGSPERREALKTNSVPPDEYVELRRWLGLYPLTRWFVARGVADWHAETREIFSLDPPSRNPTIRYRPAGTGPQAPAGQIPAHLPRDALGIPLLTAGERQALLWTFAPVWEVELKSEADRIGAPVWNTAGDLGVDLLQPRTYTRVSFTRFARKVRIQLNYVIWFSSRPKTGTLDLYGGPLDGLNYRVTLDEKGAPLLYETMHNCGCFLKAYPGHGLVARDSSGYAEKPLILQAPVVDHLRERLVISMAARTHYVTHIYPSSRARESGQTAEYSLAAYGELRSLPVDGSTRKSMFTVAGIAPGSERLERFILWPMGVVSPGAMRQWGRHAVSLIGKRHFDDPYYMDRMFLLAPDATQPHRNR